MLALLLTGGLLSVLFFNYLHLETKIQKVIQNKQEVLAEQVMQLRLSQVFEQTLQEPFYFEEGALFFHFNAGIDLDPLFCNELKCKLFLHSTALTLSCYAKNGKAREERLLSNIHTLNFSFFDQVTKQWTEQWDKNRKELPSMVQIRSSKNRRIFFIPNANPEKIVSTKKKLKV